MAISVAYWYFVLPDWEVFKAFSWGSILWLHFVNCAGIFIFYGAIVLIYYVKRKENTRFKYNHRFPSEQPSDVFWFKSKNIDNLLRTFLISIPIWTLIMSFSLWCFANGYVFWLSPDSHWLWLTALIVLVALF